MILTAISHQSDSFAVDITFYWYAISMRNIWQDEFQRTHSLRMNQNTQKRLKYHNRCHVGKLLLTWQPLVNLGSSVLLKLFDITRGRYPCYQCLTSLFYYFTTSKDGVDETKKLPFILSSRKGRKGVFSILCVPWQVQERVLQSKRDE